MSSTLMYITGLTVLTIALTIRVYYLITDYTYLEYENNRLRDKETTANIAKQGRVKEIERLESEVKLFSEANDILNDEKRGLRKELSWLEINHDMIICDKKDLNKTISELQEQATEKDDRIKEVETLTFEVQCERIQLRDKLEETEVELKELKEKGNTYTSSRLFPAFSVDTQNEKNRQAVCNDSFLLNTVERLKKVRKISNEKIAVLEREVKDFVELATIALCGEKE